MLLGSQSISDIRRDTISHLRQLLLVWKRSAKVSCTVLQEGALTALASVADAANAHFIRYYDTVMPMLKHVLYSASSKAEQLLRAKALECVSLVGMAVGKERFRADAQEVMAFMQQLQVSCLCTFGFTTHFLVLTHSACVSLSSFSTCICPGMAPVTSCTRHLHLLQNPLCCMLQATLSFILT